MVMEAGGAGGFGVTQVSVGMPALLLRWGQHTYKRTYMSVQSHSHGKCVCTAVPVCEHLHSPVQECSCMLAQVSGSKTPAGISRR